MKDINYYKSNFGKLTLEELTYYYWILIEECARRSINNEDFRSLHTELMATSTAITMINFSNAVDKLEKKEQHSK